VQASKNFVMMLIVVVALAAAGIIVLAWLALRHMLLKPLDASIVNWNTWPPEIWRRERQYRQ
jgi:uncharacterized membrane protein YqiK